jgi:hypothetical protein
MCETRAAATPTMSRTKARTACFFEEILAAEKRLLDASATGNRTREAKVIDLCKLFGSAEIPIHYNNYGWNFSVGRRRCPHHLASLQSGDETRECSPGSCAAAGEAASQTSAAAAVAGCATALAVRSATANAKISQKR